MPSATSPVSAAAVDLSGRADLLVGVTGKLDLSRVEDEVRAALTKAFDTLDRLCPDTPKVLLSALAAGADLLAAEVALARPGWRVIAPLPFSPKLYEADFKAPEDLKRFRTLSRNVETLVLQSLENPETGRPYADAELARKPGGNPSRTLHYEQVGLFIAERCALLIAIGPPDEAPDRLGGSARILSSRLSGAVDGTMEDVRRRSRELLDEGVLAEPRTGPAWHISTQGEPGEITIRNPGAAKPAPFHDAQARTVSLGLALRLNAFNRDALASVASDGSALATERLGHLKNGLTEVQRKFSLRVRFSAWGIAGLFCAAVLCLELHIEMDVYPWAEGLIVAYLALAATTIVLFLAVSSLRWQPVSEDYRAIAEALRIQMMFWDSGYSGQSRRVDLMYLRGLHGPLGWIRDAIGHFIAGTRLSAPLPEPKPEAALRWIEGQLSFFEKRIERRRGQVVFVRTTTWFLFVLGLVQALVLSIMHLSHTPTIHDAVIEMDRAGAPAMIRILGLVIVILFVWALWFGHEQEAARPVPLVRAWQALQTVAAVAAGLVLSVALCRLASLLPTPLPPPPGHLWLEEAAKRLMMLAVVLPAAFAGALRFVGEKLSWEAELQGYERAVSHFKRARLALLDQAETDDRDLARDRRERIITDLAVEALRENEAWLLAHRERPLEPVVGG